MIQCPICQVDNDDQAQFCLECGGRLSPKMSAQQPIPQLAPEMAKPEPPKPRRKLHSPILGGGSDSDFDEQGYDYDQQDQDQGFEASRPRGKKASTGQQKKGGLRSPLLSAGDDDYGDDYDDGNDYDDYGNHDNKGKKGGLRSPLLGGGGGGKTEFPHRHQTHGNRPQMEGADHDFEEQMQEPTLKSKAGGASKSHHLRSPLLSGDDYDEDFEDDYYDDDDAAPADPNALRSPLLAARSPRHEKPQAPAPAPMPAPAPAPMPVAPPQGQPNYQPQRAPSPTQSQLNLAQQMPPTPMAAPVAASAPSPVRPVAPQPLQQQQDSDRRVSDTDRRSVTRPGSDRRMSSRLLSGSSSSSSTPDFDDYDNDDPVSSKTNTYKDARDSGFGRQINASPAQPNAFAPLLVAVAGCAAFAKLWYLSGQLGNPRLFTTYLSAFVDQVASIAVLVMLMMFAINANKK